MTCRDLLSIRFMEWRQTLLIVTINIQTWANLLSNYLKFIPEKYLPLTLNQ